MVRRRIGVLVLVAALGIAGCGDASKAVRASDRGATTTTADVSETLTGPLLGDHWHVAIELSRCGEALPNPVDAGADTAGIHTHADGLIHIHPFTTTVSGRGAVLGVFLDQVGATVSDRGLELGDTLLPFEGSCDGQPAQLTLVEWIGASGADSLVTRTRITDGDQLRAIPLDHDGAAMAIALAPADADIARPASIANLDSPIDVVDGGPATTIAATGQGTSAVDVDFGFASVLGMHAPPCGDTATPEKSGTTCFELGPVRLGRDGIESAAADHSVGDWTVHVTLTPPGSDAFNVVARECFQKTASCPTGQLAIVYRGAVFNAPTVQTDHFERGAIQISGLSESEAKSMAEVLSP